MAIRITLPAYNLYKNVSFKGGHMVNIGAGQNKKEGGFNTSDNGKDLGIQSMDYGHDFPKAIADALRNNLINDKTKPAIWMAIPGGAGNDSKGHFVAITNIIGKEDGKPAGKVYINEIKEAIKGIRPDANLIVTNDGMMQAYQDMRNPEVKAFLDKNVKEGDSFIGRFGAGGCGGYTGIKTDKGIQIIPMEIGHTPIPLKEVNMDYAAPGMPTIESYAGAAPSAIRIFALALGFDPENAHKLSKTVEGRMITRDIIKLDITNHEELGQAKALGATNLFESQQKGNIKEFKLIDPQTNKPISHKRRVQGLKAAAEEYFKSIGIMLADGANHLSNTITLTAGFDAHLAKAAKEEAGLNPEQVIKETAFRNVAKSRQAALETPNNFNVLIKDTGDPSNPANAELMDAKGSKVFGGYKIGYIPNSALK